MGLVAEGRTLEEFRQIAEQLDKTWPEGQNGRLVWTLAEPLSDDDMDRLRQSLEDQGAYVFDTPPQSNAEVDAVIQAIGDAVIILDIRQVGSNLIIDFQKRFGPWLIIIGALLLLPVIVGVWRLFTQKPSDLVIKCVLPILGCFLAYKLIKGKIGGRKTEYVPYYVQAGPQRY